MPKQRTDLNDIFARLTSRKFLLAIAAFLTALDAGESLYAAIVAGIYIAAEGAADAVSRAKVPRSGDDDVLFVDHDTFERLRAQSVGQAQPEYPVTP